MATASAARSPRLLALSLTSLRRAYSSTTPLPPFPPQHILDLPRRYRKEQDKVPEFDTTERRAFMAAKAAARAASKSMSKKTGSIRPQDSSGAPSTIEKNSRKKPKLELDDSHKQYGNMYVPQVSQRFIRGGKLQTTPDVWEFLQETGIEYDNSKSRPLTLAPEHKHIIETFACKLRYSKLHIIHPYHLIFLQPRGHPFMESLKVKYRAKKETQPLWLIFIDFNADTGLVRSLGQRRLIREFWLALEELDGRGPDMTVSGTIIVSMHDAKKAASAPAWQFGQALADAVVKQHKWDHSEHRNLRARREPKVEPKNQRRKKKP